MRKLITLLFAAALTLSLSSLAPRSLANGPGTQDSPQAEKKAKPKEKKDKKQKKDEKKEKSSQKKKKTEGEPPKQ